MERFAAVARAHAVHLNDDEPQFRDLRHRAHFRAEGFRCERILRPCVDLLDHRVLLLGVEVAGAKDEAVDGGLTVAARGDEALGRLPAEGFEGLEVALLQFDDQVAIDGGSNVGDRSEIDPGTGINIELPRR